MVPSLLPIINSPSGTYTITIPSVSRVRMEPLIMIVMLLADVTSVGGGVAVGDEVSVGEGASVGDAVMAGEGAPVDEAASVVTGGSVGDGDGVTFIPLHATDTSSINAIQHN